MLSRSGIVKTQVDRRSNRERGNETSTRTPARNEQHHHQTTYKTTNHCNMTCLPRKRSTHTRRKIKPENNSLSSSPPIPLTKRKQPGHGIHVPLLAGADLAPHEPLHLVVVVCREEHGGGCPAAVGLLLPRRVPVVLEDLDGSGGAPLSVPVVVRRDGRGCVRPAAGGGEEGWPLLVVVVVLEDAACCRCAAGVRSRALLV